jgi:hypothetical protein
MTWTHTTQFPFVLSSSNCVKISTISPQSSSKEWNKAYKPIYTSLQSTKVGYLRVPYISALTLVGGWSVPIFSFAKAVAGRVNNQVLFGGKLGTYVLDSDGM